MRKTLLFSRRNAQEILRDPVNLFFCLGFPLVLLFLFLLINRAIPESAQNTMFEVQNVTPGVAMFGTVFLSLFCGMLLAKDRNNAFLMRLFASPMRPSDFIGGYTLPMLAIGMLQTVLTFTAASFSGLPFTSHTLLALVVLIPIALMFVGIGLICGSVLQETGVGGICGALLTNLVGWLSGVWIPLDLIGGAFRTISHILPFFHAAEAAKDALSGSIPAMLPHLGIVAAYAVTCYLAAIVVFRRKMRG
ncbi:MAG: ABC transporter permease [Sphaerochaetaceae bacterium]|jgi:ABC-2 type transport system permease protein|nr:ABC transporter permease [Sphaerochaeta sp.]